MTSGKILRYCVKCKQKTPHTKSKKCVYCKTKNEKCLFCHRYLLEHEITCCYYCKKKLKNER